MQYYIFISFTGFIYSNIIYFVLTIYLCLKEAVQRISRGCKYALNDLLSLENVYC